MLIEDLSPTDQPLYLVCLEDWSPEISEGACRKEQWYRSMTGYGLRVKLARDDEGTIGGMIQYVPLPILPPPEKTSILCSASGYMVTTKDVAISKTRAWVALCWPPPRRM